MPQPSAPLLASGLSRTRCSNIKVEHRFFCFFKRFYDFRPRTLASLVIVKVKTRASCCHVRPKELVKSVEMCMYKDVYCAHGTNGDASTTLSPVTFRKCLHSVCLTV